VRGNEPFECLVDGREGIVDELLVARHLGVELG
jgi:hypothetical protein